MERGAAATETERGCPSRSAHAQRGSGESQRPSDAIADAAGTAALRRIVENPGVLRACRFIAVPEKRTIMSPKTRLLISAVLAALAVAVWRTMSPSVEGPAREPVDAYPPPVDSPRPQPTPHPAVAEAGRPGPSENGSAESRAAEAAADSSPLDETTLVGTKWEREGFGFEFGADGKLFIGGRERAQWRVEGSRIRLYRDATGEEHWLDIVGDKLVWEGREIARLP